jgi:hypothetical protein
MQINPQIFYTEVLVAIREEFYKDCLFSDSLAEHIKVEELEFEDNRHPDNHRQFWGFVLKKDKKSYLISDKKLDGTELDIDQIFPLRLKHDLTYKTAYKGKVFWYVGGYTSIKVRPEKSYSFRELVDVLSCFKHSSPLHYKLLWFQELTQLIRSANFRNSTPPGFGKDSVAQAANLLHGSVSVLDDDPSKAKLEERMSVCKHLLISEVMDLPTATWKQLEQFILKAGAKKATITKRTRAYGGVKEDIDGAKLSLSLIYNDISSYPTMDKYIDFISKGAVLDRLVPFRFAGRLKEPFGDLKSTDIERLVQEGLPIFKSLIKTILYYKTNYNNYIKPLDKSKLMKLDERWHENVMIMLDIISMYVEDQEEFDMYINEINLAHQDYNHMLKYPIYHERLKKVLPVDEFEKVEEHCIMNIMTFKDRNSYLENYLSEKQNQVIKDVEWNL